MLQRVNNLILLLLAFTIYSCGDPNLAPSEDLIPQCEFDTTETIEFTNFGLKIPPFGMSTYFTNVFNQDIIYDLNQILETDGDYRILNPSMASISGNLKSDGKYCKGEKPFLYKKGNENILLNSIKVPAPSSTGFQGEVSITVRTDDFQDYNGSIYYYVRWNTTSNDPDQFVDGDLEGEKVPFDTEGFLIMPPDQPLYIDGTYQLN